jgi:hypothetical protein
MDRYDRISGIETRQVDVYQTILGLNRSCGADAINVTPRGKPWKRSAQQLRIGPEYDSTLDVAQRILDQGPVNRFVQLELEFHLHAIGTAERIPLRAMRVEHG